MNNFNKNVLSVLSEAIVLVRNKKIFFSNSPAAAILGENIVGKRLSEVFGADISAMQSNDFTATACLNRKDCVVRSSKMDNDQILVINELKFDNSLINDTSLYSIRASLMMNSISVEQFRKLAEESGNMEMLASADLMSKNLSSLSRLVSNVSIVFGFQSQSLHFSPKPQNVSKLFSEYTDIVASLLPDVAVAFEAPESLYASVDNDLIISLLTNLISNSVLHGKCSRLHIRLIDSGDYVILAFNDNGCGIRPEAFYNVFERYRDTSELTDICRGAGLGLSVVLAISRLHEGTVILDSHVDHGTAIRVSLRKNLSGTSLFSFIPSTEDIKGILTGLADCVDEMRFREAYSEF